MILLNDEKIYKMFSYNLIDSYTYKFKHEIKYLKDERKKKQCGLRNNLHYKNSKRASSIQQ